jgi:hypothetical protein
MGVNKGPWTDQENERLKTFVAQGASIIRAAAVFNRTSGSIRAHCFWLFCSDLHSRARLRPDALRRALERDSADKNRKLPAVESISPYSYRWKGFGCGGCFGQHWSRGYRKGVDPRCLCQRPTHRKRRVWQMERRLRRNCLQRPLGSITTVRMGFACRATMKCPSSCQSQPFGPSLVPRACKVMARKLSPAWTAAKRSGKLS